MKNIKIQKNRSNEILKNNEGFTLIELIVVMAIIAILVLLASPKFMSYTSRAKTTRKIHDVGVAEKLAEEYLVDNKNNYAEWEMIHPSSQNKNVYSKEGLIDIVSSKEYRIIPQGIVDKTGTKLDGMFFIDEDGIAYYKDDRINGSQENTEYTEEEFDDKRIQDLIDMKYVPVASREDLEAMKVEKKHLFGKGTKWEREAVGGLNKGTIYIQVRDINMGGTLFSPLGTSSQNFYGTYDGGNYKIKNLYVRGNERSGLFGITQNSTIKNVRVVGGDVSGDFNVGGLIGATLAGDIINSSYEGVVSGTGVNVGGLVGYATVSEEEKNNTTVIKNSYANARVTNGNTGGLYTGGFVGRANKSLIEDSYSLGKVVSSSNGTGGFIGYANSTNAYNSYALGDVTSKGKNTGGFIGYAKGAKIDASYATGNVTGGQTGNYDYGKEIGGLVGLLEDSEVINSHATGGVDGFWSIGGLVGRMDRSSLQKTYATGHVNNTIKGNGGNVGGLVGQIRDHSRIYESYSNGNANAGEGDGVGALVGRSKGTNIVIKDSYATGRVRGRDYLGGIVGREQSDQGSISIISSYYDKQTTGIINNEDHSKTTSEMKNVRTYKNWDFNNTWELKRNSYPTFK